MVEYNLQEWCVLKHIFSDIFGGGKSKPLALWCPNSSPFWPTHTPKGPPSFFVAGTSKDSSGERKSPFVCQPCLSPYWKPAWLKSPFHYYYAYYYEMGGGNLFPCLKFTKTFWAKDARANRTNVRRRRRGGGFFMKWEKDYSGKGPYFALPSGDEEGMDER